MYGLVLAASDKAACVTNTSLMSDQMFDHWENLLRQLLFCSGICLVSSPDPQLWSSAFTEGLRMRLVFAVTCNYNGHVHCFMWSESQSLFQERDCFPRDIFSVIHRQSSLWLPYIANNYSKRENKQRCVPYSTLSFISINTTVPLPSKERDRKIHFHFYAQYATNANWGGAWESSRW